MGSYSIGPFYKNYTLSVFIVKLQCGSYIFVQTVNSLSLLLPFIRSIFCGLWLGFSLSNPCNFQLLLKLLFEDPLPSKSFKVFHQFLHIYRRYQHHLQIVFNISIILTFPWKIKLQGTFIPIPILLFSTFPELKLSKYSNYHCTIYIFVHFVKYPKTRHFFLITATAY